MWFGEKPPSTTAFLQECIKTTHRKKKQEKHPQKAPKGPARVQRALTGSKPAMLCPVLLNERDGVVFFCFLSVLPFFLGCWFGFTSLLPSHRCCWWCLYAGKEIIIPLPGVAINGYRVMESRVACMHAYVEGCPDTPGANASHGHQPATDLC